MWFIYLSLQITPLKQMTQKGLQAVQRRQLLYCTQTKSQTFTVVVNFTRTKGYLDFPLMPSRRAFMLGKTFFMIFPKSAALSGLQPRLSQQLLEKNRFGCEDKGQHTHHEEPTPNVWYSLVLIINLLLWEGSLWMLLQVIPYPVECMHLLSAT